MRARRITPTAVIIRQSEIWGTKVSCSNEDGRTPWMAPLWFISTLDLKTCSTAKSIIEERRTQSCSVHSISLAVKVTITTRSTCIPNQNKTKQAEINLI